MTTISSSDTKMTVTSSSNMFLEELLSDNELSYAIPSLRLLPEETNEFHLKIIENPSPGFFLEKEGATVQGNLNDLKKGLFHLIKYLYQPLYQKKGKYNIHSASVGFGNNAVLLLGPPKAGKTTISLSFNARVYGDDSSILEKDCTDLVLSGANQIALVPKGQSKEYVKLTPMLSKSKVSSIYFIRLNPHDQTYKTLDRIQSLISLYDEFSYFIRGSTFALFDLGIALPCLDTQELAQKRLNFLRDISSRIQIRYIIGSKEFIIEKIKENEKTSN